MFKKKGKIQIFKIVFFNLVMTINFPTQSFASENGKAYFYERVFYSRQQTSLKMLSSKN